MSYPTPPPSYRYPPPPRRRRHRWPWIVLGVILALALLFMAIAVIGVATSSSSSDSTPSSSSVSPAQAVVAAGLNQPVRDGKFEFTVNGVDCSKTSLGSSDFGTHAQGVFCIVSLRVSNIGNEAQDLDGTSQYGYDAQGRKFQTDTEAILDLPDKTQTFFNQINPGSSVDGQLVYDVPLGTKLTKLELHDSAFSGGVDVNLG